MEQPENAAVAEAAPEEVATLPNDVQPSEPIDQPQEPESPEQVQAPEQEPAQKLPEGIDSEVEWLEHLLKIQHDPGREPFNDDELDVLDKYYAGDLERDTGKKPEPKQKETNKEPEPKEDEETHSESEEDSFEVDEATMNDSSSLDLEIMKEVGAKSKTEIVSKIKGLRKAISGKLEADPGYKSLQENAEFMQKSIQNEKKLWDDLAKGNPRAIEYAKNTYGVDFGKGNTVSPNSDNDSPKNISGDTFQVDPEQFIDEEAAEQVNGVLRLMKSKMDELEGFRTDMEKREMQTQNKLAEQEAQSTVVDEMVQIAENIPKLKGVKNVRQAIVKWRKGAPDARMNYFQDLFDIANEKNIDLVTALEIDQGRKARLSVKVAKEEGRKEAYSHTPNKSLSDLQGKHIDKPEEYSEAQIENMIYSGNMPDHWFDKNDNPDPKQIPKNAWHHFWPGGTPIKT